MEEEILDESLETVDAAENTEVETEEVDNDILDRAKELGYKTDDEYTGNPKYKLTPEEYVKRAEKGGTIKKLESDIAESRREAQEMRQAFDKMQKFTKLQIESAKEKALEELRRNQVRAVDEDGISAADAFTAYEQGKERVEKQYTVEEEKPQRQEPPEINKFYQENPWYNSDPIMQGAANALHGQIANQYPTMPLGQQLDMVKKRIVESFPDKFENQKKRQQSIEGGGSVHGGAVRRKDTFASLGFSNADIIDAQKLIKSGDFKSEADFIKSYKILNGVK